MKPVRDDIQTTEGAAREFSLAGACLICDGDLLVRVGSAGASTFCPACRWISRPQVKRGENGIHVIHPAGLVA